MTREEAIEVLQASSIKQMSLTKIVVDGKYLSVKVALEMAIKALKQEPFDIETYCKEHFCVMVDKDVWEKAEKALKQENVLDEIFENIKTEIDFIPTYGAKFADGSINVHVNKKDVLQIIDKYRGESDCRECKAEHDCYECEKYAESEES